MANENLTVAASAREGAEKVGEREKLEYLAKSKLANGSSVYADWHMRGHGKCHLPIDLMVPRGSDLCKWLGEFSLCLLAPLLFYLGTSSPLKYACDTQMSFGVRFCFWNSY